MPAKAAAAAQIALDLQGTFAKTGTNQYTRLSGDYNVNTTMRPTGLGNSAIYLARRLKKAGREDLLEQVRDGDIRSIRKAAIEAGIVKDVPVVRYARKLMQATEVPNAPHAAHLNGAECGQVSQVEDLPTSPAPTAECGQITDSGKLPTPGWHAHLRDAGVQARVDLGQHRTGGLPAPPIGGASGGPC